MKIHGIQFGFMFLTLNLLLLTGCQPAPQQGSGGLTYPTAPTPGNEIADPRGFLFEHRAKALEIVQAAAESPLAGLRTNALEAAQDMPEHARDMLAQGIRDDNPAVRFVALTVMGKLRLSSLIPDARARLQMVMNPYGQLPSLLFAAVR
ncbi:MAG: HEAT repeat domain-containing protein [Phycisphaerales bacterium]|nr:HEAT repeat domain-containing protein [Phycisphaerales bacterium]